MLIIEAICLKTLKIMKRKYSKPPDVNRYAEKKNIKKEKEIIVNQNLKNNVTKRKAFEKEDYSYYFLKKR